MNPADGLLQEAAPSAEENDEELFDYELLEDGTACITYYYGDEADVTFPAVIDGHAVTAIGNSECIFMECNWAVEHVTVPEGVTRIGREAFSECDSLTSITILKDSGFIDIGEGAFNWCDSLTSITFATDSGHIDIDKDMCYDYNASLRITVPNQAEAALGWFEKPWSDHLKELRCLMEGVDLSGCVKYHSYIETIHKGYGNERDIYFLEQYDQAGQLIASYSWDGSPYRDLWTKTDGYIQDLTATVWLNRGTAEEQELRFCCDLGNHDPESEGQTLTCHRNWYGTGKNRGLHKFTDTDYILSGGKYIPIEE